MLLNMKELTTKDKALAISERVDVSGMLSERQDIADFGTLLVELIAQGESGIVDVKGELRLRVRMACSRCLTDLEEELIMPFHERFTQRAELIRQEDEENTHLAAEPKVDLRPFVEEAVWLALPYAPVCRDDCQGLCPECGTNRNEQRCSCTGEKLDPRLAGLADFFNKR